MVKVSSVAQKSQHLRPQQYLPSRCGGGFPNSKKKQVLGTTVATRHEDKRGIAYLARVSNLSSR